MQTFSSFILGVNSLIYNPQTDTFKGDSCGEKFELRGCADFYWGGSKLTIRASSKVRYNLDSDEDVKIRATVLFKSEHSEYSTDISVETIYAYLQALHSVTMPALGLVGNAMNNDAARLFETGGIISKGNTELVTTMQNRWHGDVWNAVFKDTGIRLWFSAKNTKFKDYIGDIVGSITVQHLLDYPGKKGIVTVPFKNGEFEYLKIDL